MKSFDCGPDENSLSRRKNNNPRKIARETEESGTQVNNVNGGIPSASGLLAISTNPMCSSSTPSQGSAVCSYSNGRVSAANSTSQLAQVLTSASSKTNQKDGPAEQKVYSCLLCEQNFTQRSALDRHFSTVHGIEPYEVLSQTSFLQQSYNKPYSDEANDEELAESMMEQETIIFCEVCRREFQDRASLWLHMVHAHREEASVSCGICLKICSDNITLIEHVNTAHSGDKAVVQRRYSCQVCGRQHDSRQKLLKHATLHTLIDNQGQTIQPEEMVSLNNAFAPRECPICHKRFFNEEKLGQHTQNFHSDGAHDTSLGASGTSSSSTASVIYKCELCVSTHATRMDRWWHMYYSHNGDSRITCERTACRKIFVTQALRDEHSRTHHETQGNFTNTCEICGKLWESRPVFYKHMMNVHPKCLPTICGVCLKIFSNVGELREHVQSNHPALGDSGSICCDVCGRPYAERSKMLRHRRVHNVTDGVPSAAVMVRRKDDLLCNICPELCFDKLEDIAEHRKNAHQLFVCDLCPKFYNGNNHLWKHVSKQHKGDPSVTCNLCLRTSASRAHLERHKLKYHSDPVDKLIDKPPSDATTITHKCHLCAKIFRIRSLLKKHLKSCKGAKPRAPKMLPVNGVFPCSKCHKVFEVQSVLSKHMKNSHVVHYCEGCEPEKVGFDSKTALFEHIRAEHASDPELVCDVEGCDKVLRLKADLQKHKQEHLRGYFTYICEMCGDTFSNRKKLRKHLLTFHKGSVPHLCAACVAILPTVDELIEHVQNNHPVLLHRPCTCQVCGKCYPVSCKVIEHVGKAHGKEFRPCKICWKVFRDEKEYEEHVQNHPPTEEKPVAAPAKRPEARIRAKSNLSQELAALGINVEGERGGTKRSAEEEPNYEESGKRLRKKYKCTSCRETFRAIEELKEHKAEEHGNGHVNAAEEYEAAVAAANSLPEADPRTERWTDFRPIKCDSCGRTWNTKKQLWQHLIRSHPFDSMHTCGLCLKVCKNYYELFYHLDEQHSSILNDSQNRFTCYVCGHLHNSHSKLDKHLGVHKNPPVASKYTCQYCQLVFKSVVFYREHLRHHESTSASAQPRNESSEFSGFSINSILESRLKDEPSENEVKDEDLVEMDDDYSDSENESDTVEEREFKGYDNSTYSKQLVNASSGSVGQLDQKVGVANSPYDIKMEEDVEEDEDEDEEDEDEEDDDDEEDMEDEEQGSVEAKDEMDADLESELSCSSVEGDSTLNEDNALFNGKRERDEEGESARFGFVNNNQNHERKVPHFEEKRKFSTSNGEKFYVE